MTDRRGGGREGKGGREEGREGEREGGREGKGGREEGREGEREGEREEGREGRKGEEEGRERDKTHQSNQSGSGRNTTGHGRQITEDGGRGWEEWRCVPNLLGGTIRHGNSRSCQRHGHFLIGDGT